MRGAPLLGWLVCAVLTGAPAMAQARSDARATGPDTGSQCDPALLDAYPEDVPAWDPQSGYETVYDWLGTRSEIPLGIGHLKGADRFWWEGRPLRLPLRAAPGAAAWGWFANGWLIETASPDVAPRPIGVQGSVETGYETTSFIVLEATADGWLRFRYGKPSPAASGSAGSVPRDGLAWVHRCHLARESLVFERWEDRFLSGEISPLFFRSDVPHELHERPHDESRRVFWIANDHHLEPLAFKGDWMQVLVKQPSDYCAPPEALKVEAREGWVRWRSPRLGPIVWYHTRGC
jgi:hypothetical protein